MSYWSKLLKLKSLRAAMSDLKTEKFVESKNYDVRGIHKTRKLYLFRGNLDEIYLTTEEHLFELCVINSVPVRLIKLAMQHSPSTAILNMLESPNRVKLLDYIIFNNYVDINRIFQVMSPGLIASTMRSKYFNRMWRYLEHKVWNNREDSMPQIRVAGDSDGFQYYKLCKGPIVLATIGGNRELTGSGSFGYDAANALIKLQDYKLLSRSDMTLFILATRTLSSQFACHPVPCEANGLAYYMTLMAKKYHEMNGMTIPEIDEIVSPDKIKLMLGVIGLI